MNTQTIFKGYEVNSRNLLQEILDKEKIVGRIKLLFSRCSFIERLEFANDVYHNETDMHITEETLGAVTVNDLAFNNLTIFTEAWV